MALMEIKSLENTPENTPTQTRTTVLLLFVLSRGGFHLSEFFFI